MSNRELKSVAKLFSPRALVIPLLAFSTSQAWAESAGLPSWVLPMDSITFAPREMKPECSASNRTASEALNTIYDRSFKYYADVFGVSLFQKRTAGTGGGFGHTVLLLKGVRIARDSNGKPKFPRALEVTADGSGHVIVSTNAGFKNQQWAAAEGREFGLYGNQKSDQPFTYDSYLAIMKEAERQGVLDGYEFNPDEFNDPILKDAHELHKALNRGARTEESLSAEEKAQLEQLKIWAFDNSMGTDFAVAAARGGSSGTRIPLVGIRDEKAPMQDVVNELNEANRIAAEKGFHYNGFVNSCTTNAYNALAAIGFWSPVDTSAVPGSTAEILEQSLRGNVQAPYNTVFKALNIGNRLGSQLQSSPTRPILGLAREALNAVARKKAVVKLVLELARDEKKFSDFQRRGWLPHQLGTILDNVPSLDYQNQVYRTNEVFGFKSLPRGLNEFFGRGDRVKEILATRLPTDPTRTVGDLIFNAGDEKSFRTIRDNAKDFRTNLFENVKYWEAEYPALLAALNEFQARRDIVLNGVPGLTDLEDLIDDSVRARISGVLEQLKTYFSAQKEIATRLKKRLEGRTGNAYNELVENNLAAIEKTCK